MASRVCDNKRRNEEFVLSVSFHTLIFVVCALFMIYEYSKVCWGYISQHIHINSLKALRLYILLSLVGIKYTLHYYRAELLEMRPG